jgi:hypothetical protein
MRKPVILSWTHHAQAKMNFYRLSQSRVRRVLNTPKRTEEGVAPKTIAMMQPAAMKNTGLGKESWTQEIWVMVQDSGQNRKVISAWRYPGVTKPRSAAAIEAMKREYREFIAGDKEEKQ